MTPELNTKLINLLKDIILTGTCSGRDALDILVAITHDSAKDGAKAQEPLTPPTNLKNYDTFRGQFGDYIFISHNGGWALAIPHAHEVAGHMVGLNPNKLNAIKAFREHAKAFNADGTIRPMETTSAGLKDAKEVVEETDWHFIHTNR